VIKSELHSRETMLISPEDQIDRWTSYARFRLPWQGTRSKPQVIDIGDEKKTCRCSLDADSRYVRCLP
jgi:hypothetical protein